VSVRDVIWHGEPGNELLSDEVAVVVLPRRGAKIASLRHLPSGREWLEQPAADLREAAAYGSAFTDGEMFGWDEMVPTIVACRYPGEPHGDATLPDHGEVWTLVWSAERAGDAVVCSTGGRVLPYRFTRTMRVAGATLTLDYRLASTGSTPLWLLWAAHPQFLVSQAGTRVVLPPEVDRLVDVTPGRSSHAVAWPSAAAESTLGLSEGAGSKLYVAPETHVGTASLIDGDGSWLRLTWNPDVVGYLGIWLDNRAYARHPVIALEPTTGYYDDLALAVSQGRASSISPEQPLQWTVEVTMGTGQR
jgi:galactose mutarotase-like enzyme